MSIGDGLTVAPAHEPSIATAQTPIRRGTCNGFACSCNEEQHVEPFRKENNALRKNVYVLASPRISGRSLREIVVCAEIADAASGEGNGKSAAHASDRSGLTGRHNDCRRQTQASQSVAA
jgi:hypothetical protein